MRFVRVISLMVLFLATDCCGQTTNETYTKQEPPKLELAFSDDFSQDTRSNYTIKGDVSWEQGKLALSDGASIACEINGAAWAELELDLHFPELTEDGQTSELRISFDMGDSATACYISLSQHRSEGNVSSKICCYETGGQFGEKPTAKLVRQMAIKGRLVGGLWKLKYRKGLIMVASTNAELFAAYIQIGSSLVKGVSLGCDLQVYTLGGITVLQMSNTEGDYTAKEMKQLARADKANQKAIKFFKEGKYCDAAAAGEEDLKIKKSVLGEYHMGYAHSLNNLASAYAHMGKYASAEPLHTQTVKTLKSILGEHHPIYAISLDNLAFLHTSKGDHASAEPFYRQAAEIRKLAFGDDHLDYAHSLHSLAGLYYRIGDFTRAEFLYKQALKIKKTAVGENHPDYASSAGGLAVVYMELGNFRRAETLYKQVLEIRKSVLGEAHPEYAMSMNNLATLYSNLGDFTRAEPLYKQALEIQKSVLGEAHPDYAGSVNNLAAMYHRMGDYKVAAALYKEALEIRRSIFGKDHDTVANSLNNLAAMYHQMGDYRRSVSLLLQALEIQKSVLGEAHPEYAMSIHNLAAGYSKLGDFTRAEPLYKQALEIRKSVLGEAHPEYAMSMNNLATLYSNLGEFTRAEPLHKQALEIQKLALGEAHPEYATSLNNLATLYSNLGEFTRAEPLHNQALEIQKLALGEAHPEYSNSLNGLALLFSMKGDYARAEQLFNQALGTERQQLYLNSLIQSERQQKQNQSVKRFFLDSQLANSQLLKSHTAEVLNSLWRWKGAVTFRQQAYRAISANPKLVPLFESLQSVSQQLSVATTQTPVPPPTSADQTKRANYRLRRDQWEERFAKLIRASEDLQQQIAAGSEEFRELQEPLTAEIVQNILPVGTAFVDFIEYEHKTPSSDKKGIFNAEQRYIAFVVTKDREPVMVGLGDAHSFEDTINELRRPFAPEQNATENREAAKKAGQQLRNELWVPIEKHLGGIETVIISPDTALGTLPWAALPGRKPNSFLLEDYRLASIPFANLLPRLMREQANSTDNRGLLVVGDVDYDAALASQSNSKSEQLPALAMEQGILNRTRGDMTDGWKSLPGFQRELETVRSLHKRQFGSTSPIKTLSGTKATESELLKNASQFSTLHLVTHGYFEDPDVKSIDQAEISHDAFSSQLQGPDPFINTWMPGLLSGLVMAGANHPTNDPEDLNDGILRASEIEAISLQNVDLVVLSACDTGLGAVAGGEGLTGLQRSFQMAGAKTVVASLWKVDDRATQELMQRFYENLWVKQMSKIDALREAQLWMLRHPKELGAIVFKDVRTRSDPRDPKPTTTNSTRPNTNGTTDPYFWAAFQLSGDWR